MLEFPLKLAPGCVGSDALVFLNLTGHVRLPFAASAALSWFSSTPIPPSCGVKKHLPERHATAGALACGCLMPRTKSDAFIASNRCLHAKTKGDADGSDYVRPRHRCREPHYHQGRGEALSVQDDRAARRALRTNAFAPSRPFGGGENIFIDETHVLAVRLIARKVSNSHSCYALGFQWPWFGVIGECGVRASLWVGCTPKIGSGLHGFSTWYVRGGSFRNPHFAVCRETERQLSRRAEAR